MAISSANIVIENNEYKGGIEIKSTKATNSLGSISYMMIYRSYYNDIDSKVKLYEIALSSANDLTFELLDITSCSNHKYTYYIDLTNNNTSTATILQSATISGIVCEFNGMFIGDYDKQYFAQLDVSTNAVQNTQVNYVTTLSSRTPYRVSNANTNYATGQSSGLFFETDANNRLIVRDNRDYVNEIIAYLMDGNEKILKTSDGDIWYVSIDESASGQFNDRYKGKYEIQFNWTEIGDVPTGKKIGVA